MRFGFIGCGHMGATLVRKVSEVEKSIAVCDHSESKIEPLVAECGAKKASANEIAARAKFVVLGVKPQVIFDTIGEIKEAFCSNENAVVISMAAGVSTGALIEATGSEKVIRIMPNMPVLLGKGVITYALGTGVTEEEERDFLSAFSTCGTLEKIDEKDMDASSVVAGCAPAYAYEFIGALAEAGVEMGLDEKTALSLVCETVKGAAEMALKFEDTAALTDGVCSKGGTTIEGVKVLREQNFAETVKAAALASYKRTLELKK